jgi:hypothetical protein
VSFYCCYNCYKHWTLKFPCTQYARD